MMDAHDILLRISRFYSTHLDIIHQAAADEDDFAMDEQMKKLEGFKRLVKDTLGATVLLHSTTYGIKPPRDADMFTATVVIDDQDYEAMFPDMFGLDPRWVKLDVAEADGSFTALYMKESHDADA